jgi:tricorn protease
VNIREGEHIVAVNGRRLDEKTSVHEALVHLAGSEVELTVRDEEGETRTKTVKTLRSEFGARYREWVQANRKRVHDASEGRLGYVHIPDMSAQGFAEFHRGFLPELRREGLVVDVRNNGGGHVSQLILEKLARERIGYDVGRWTQPLPYPEESIDGPIVAVTDENAGSDGDIFSHCFKLMELGPLVGKRTWGGVVGIWPRHRLVDGSVTTQPEFAFWFDDVGFGVENYGTAPDHDVELPPEAVAKGEDPQLDYAIVLAMKDLRKHPPKLPNFGPSPNLVPPPEE